MSIPCHPMSAAALIADQLGRLLIVRPAGESSGWHLPGGLVEAGESPRDAARREVREEVGLDLELGELLSVNWVAPRTPRRLPRLAFLFAGPVLPISKLSGLRPQLGEIRACRMVPYDRALLLLHPLVAARIPHRDRPISGSVYRETRTAERTSLS